jgi:hypothetical protein
MRTSWVKLLVEGLDAVMKKLDQYYGKMYTNLGSYYTMGTLLNPNSKNTAFHEKYTWLNSDSRDWQSEFEEQFRELYRKYYQHKANNTERLRVVRERNIDPLALMLDRSQYLQASIRSSSDPIQGPYDNSTDDNDKVSEWFAISKRLSCFSINLSTNRLPDYRLTLIPLGSDPGAILSVWKLLEAQLPGLAYMARDLLCIPLSGVGIERVFNFACDICYYRRGQLNPATIRALILVYHSQNREVYIDRLQDSVLKTIDVRDMTEEEVDDEIAIRESEMSGKYQNLELWDRNFYISDEDSDTEHNVPNHTERFKRRDPNSVRCIYSRQSLEIN